MTTEQIIAHGVVKVTVTAQTTDLAPSINKQLLENKVTIENPNCWVQETTIDSLSEIEQVTQFTHEKDKLVTGTVSITVRTVVEKPTQPHNTLTELMKEARGITAGERYSMSGVELTETKEATTENEIDDIETTY